MAEDQKRAFLAVALSAVVLFGWQFFFAPPPPKSKPVVSPSTPLKSSVARYRQKKGSLPLGKTFSIQNGTSSVKFSENLELREVNGTDSALSFSQVVGEGKSPFKIQVVIDRVPKSIPFALSREGGNQLAGNNHKHGISFIARISEDGIVSLQLSSQTPRRYRFVMESQAKQENQKIRQFVIFNRSDLERIDVGDDENFEGKVEWFGVDYNYHLFFLNFAKKRSSMVETSVDGEFALSTLEAVSELTATMAFTKKNFDRLASLGDNLNLAVDLDIWFLAVPILRGLQFFYKSIENYGLCIILLTLIIRIVTFPLQYKSFKSMKKMQVIQPELLKIRVRHKQDPKRMQQETMALFKRSGTNPMSGCLPMLLQLPIFFAFYSVLREAVELVGAPFYGHITDLSLKDPYYILPVLVCLVFLLNQKLTPMATTDPTQKKIMMLMPLVFGFIMKDLPSGLSLYILVSTLFGIVQQVMVYRFS